MKLALRFSLRGDAFGGLVSLSALTLLLALPFGLEGAPGAITERCLLFSHSMLFILLKFDSLLLTEAFRDGTPP